MTAKRYAISSASAHAQIDPEGGQISRLILRHHGREIDALHRAPWLDEQEIQNNEALSPSLRRLAGSFFCAPFGDSEDPQVPAHGHSANARWRITRESPGELEMVCSKLISGAQLSARLGVGEDGPLLYQEHWLSGGAGKLTAAHHPMIHLSRRGRFFCSPKVRIITPSEPLDSGCNLLKSGQSAKELTTVAARAGGFLDLSYLPIGSGHEDFVILVEAAATGIGWSAVLREHEDDIIFVLKPADILPVTMLWFSNGGRQYAPWNGRHLGVIGIEDGRAFGTEGQAAAHNANALNDAGIPTYFELGSDRVHRITHVIGSVARPRHWDALIDITVRNNTVRLTGPRNDTLDLPFRPGFFDGDY